MISHSSPRPASALRVRMIEDMTVRGFSEKTRSEYTRNVRAFAAFIGRSPGPSPISPLSAGREAAGKLEFSNYPPSGFSGAGQTAVALLHDRLVPL